jgi:hypothetical protein
LAVRARVTNSLPQGHWRIVSVSGGVIIAEILIALHKSGCHFWPSLERSLVFGALKIAVLVLAAPMSPPLVESGRSTEFVCRHAEVYIVRRLRAQAHDFVP